MAENGHLEIRGSATKAPEKHVVLGGGQHLEECVKDKREVGWAKLKSQCHVADDRFIVKPIGHLVNGVTTAEVPGVFALRSRTENGET